VFQPANMPTSTCVVNGNMPSACPYGTVLLRNHWETYNTTSGKSYGGFDQYNVNNVPSCVEREGNYMNFMDFVNPWSRVMVDVPVHDNFSLIADGSWMSPMSRNLESRYKNVKYL
jgi:hypothetical protein